MQAKLHGWNHGNPQDDVLAPSQSQTKPPNPVNKLHFHRLRVYMGFRGSLSSRRKKLKHRLAGRGGSDVAGKGLGLGGLLPRSEPHIVASGRNYGKRKGTVVDRGTNRFDRTTSTTR